MIPATAISLDETAMALMPASTRRTHVAVAQPKVRYNAALRELNAAPQFERPHRITIGANLPPSLTGEDIAAEIDRFRAHFTAALTDVVVWDERSLQSTFSAFSEDYDVVAVQEAGLSASTHFGW
ncbi:MAG: hypothetical protein ACREUT_10840 [Steroidobacteraceae bacterium]